MALVDLVPDARLLPFNDMPAPVGGGLVAGPDGAVRLRGSCCRDCGELAFPVRHVCMGCGSRDLDETPLAGAGQLYSVTTVHVSSSREVPYTIGYIDLDDGVRVLAEVDPAVAMGGRVSLVAADGSFHFVAAAEV